MPRTEGVSENWGHNNGHQKISRKWDKYGYINWLVVSTPLKNISQLG
jgi:hypothetical protein